MRAAVVHRPHPAAIEGFSFFLGAIFLGIDVSGWDRLSRRMHLLSGIPIAVTGFPGSWMVIPANAWMNHPSGFRWLPAASPASTPGRRTSATASRGTSSSTYERAAIVRLMMIAA